jgi:hypothetical protein
MVIFPTADSDKGKFIDFDTARLCPAFPLHSRHPYSLPFCEAPVFLRAHFNALGCSTFHPVRPQDLVHVSRIKTDSCAGESAKNMTEFLQLVV